ncbi:hypothetical protein Ahy_A01g000273 [Arachis hypogaea]|uniref:Aminotransferase-like plant mobile domain-containing protein n=1 Tax=Arachis hypogaea TaxID=3818 RepID=A0A445EJR1_ARAHY|nr:hypothetical protein Ahy_A01g000273 [Arachis hypogaea]
MGELGVSPSYDGGITEIGRTDLGLQNRMDRFLVIGGKQIPGTDLRSPCQVACMQAIPPSVWLKGSKLISQLHNFSCPFHPHFFFSLFVPHHSHLFFSVFSNPTTIVGPLKTPEKFEKMPKRRKIKDVNQPELHIANYLGHPNYLTWFRRLKERIVLTDDFHIQMWQNWERENYGYRYHSVLHYRRLLDDMQEGHFVWQAYGIGHVGPDMIPLDIRHNSVIWSARVPLISFECVEWHATDRIRRQFGLNQGVPNQPRDLGASHGEVLTGPKNQDWANTHSEWVMQWTNRYSHILVDEMGPPYYSLDTYMHWYRGAFGAHLQLSDLVAQENPEKPPVDIQENQQEQPAPQPHPPSPHPSPPPPQAQQDVEYFAPYVPHTQPSDYLSPSVPIHQQYWGGLQFETVEQGSFSQLLGFMGSSGVGHSYSGNYADIPADHWARSGGVTQRRRSLDLRPQDRTSSENSGARMSVDSNEN